MKLNPECVRDIMLSLEELTGIYCHEDQKTYLFNKVSWITVARSLIDKADYTAEEIQYTLIQLHESEYIHMEYKIEKGKPQLGNIFYLSPRGHDFLADIKNHGTWEDKISPILKAIQNVSLSIIETVSKGIASAVIEKAMQANYPANS